MAYLPVNTGNGASTGDEAAMLGIGRYVGSLWVIVIGRLVWGVSEYGDLSAAGLLASFPLSAPRVFLPQQTLFKVA